MARRSTRIVLLVWLVLLSVAGAIWAVLSETAPTPEQPVDGDAAPTETGGTGDADRPRWTLTGYVWDAHGRHLDGAHVEVAGQRLRTDPRGEFVVPDLPWRELDVVAWKEGHTLATRRVSPGDVPELRLRRLLDIRGSVRRPDGSTIAGHVVRLRLSGSGVRKTTAAADGTFTFDDVPSGSHHVRAAALAEPDAAYLSIGARVAAGEDDVVLELPAADAFRGRVVGPDDAAVEGADVHVRFYRHGRTQDGERTRTDADGRFAVVVPLDQRCSVLVDTPTPEDGWRFKRWYRHRILPSDGRLDVRLEEGHVIAGRVVANRGVSVAGRRVSAFRIAGRARNLVTEGVVKPDGTFRIGGLWDADYELRVSGATALGDPLIATPNRAIASGTEDAVIRLHRARPLAGLVFDANGEPLTGAVIYALQSELRFTEKTSTDHAGRFAIARVPPGSLRLRVRPGGVIGSDIECGTWHGGDTNIEIHLEP